MTIIKGKTSWIDVFKPNEKDLEAIKKHGKFHPLILKELTSPSARARVEEHEGYIFIAHHIPIYNEETKTSRRAEIDFLITKNKIITARYEPLKQIDRFMQELMRDKDLQKALLAKPSYILLHQIMENIMNFSMRQLRHIEERVGYIAQGIFVKQGQMLKAITHAKRDILDYRLIVRPHEELFSSLKNAGHSFWGRSCIVYLNDLSGENLRVFQRLETYHQIVESLEQTNSQILNITTNNIIKRFTILAFLFTIPLFFIFSMGVSFVNSIVNTPAKFWGTLAFIILLVFYLILVFKKKKML